MRELPRDSGMPSISMVVSAAIHLVAVLVPFVAADVWAVRRGLWSYSQRHVVGVTLFGSLPVEEVLFFVVIPLCALLTFGAVTTMLEHAPRGHPTRHRKVD